MADGSPDIRIINSAVGRHVFLVDGSRLFGIDAGLSAAEEEELLQLVRRQLATRAPRIRPAEALAPPPLQTLSLNVAQACNMSCGYCYAGEGSFGGRARLMSMETARAAVDRLCLARSCDHRGKSERC